MSRKYSLEENILISALINMCIGDEDMTENLRNIALKYTTIENMQESVSQYSDEEYEDKIYEMFENVLKGGKDE